MTEDKNQLDETKTIVGLEITPFDNDKVYENQNDFYKKITLTISCNGSKLTKADAGFDLETTQEVAASVKLTKADAGRLAEIDVKVNEKCGAKLTKADAGLV